MSSRKRGSGADVIYNRHLNGTMFANNPTNNRVAIIERMYLRVLTELAVNRFKWSGFPDSVDVRFLEMTLFYQALSVFYYDTDYDQYFALRGGSTNFLNMLDNPTGFFVVGNNFQGKTVSAKRAVPIWANYVRIPDLDIVTIYASRLAEMDRTVEINSANARRSKYIVTTQNQQLSFTNINRQIDEGQNGISVGGAVQDLDAINNVDLCVDPVTVLNLHILRTREWSECMGLLGIENANQDKKERLVSAEVDANSDQTSMMRFVNLNARRMACDKINKMYPDLNISVEYNTDVERQLNQLTSDAEDVDGEE
jgi:hypothetical protein